MEETQRSPEQQAAFEAAEALNQQEAVNNTPAAKAIHDSEDNPRTPEQQAAFDAAEAKNLAAGVAQAAPAASEEVVLEVQDVQESPNVPELG